MHTTDTIIKEIEAIQYRSFPFVGIVTRNNARNKELSFTLKQLGNWEQYENGGIGRNVVVYIEIDVVMDVQHNTFAWNYISPAMQLMAELAIVETTHRTTLHEKLIAILCVQNKLKIQPVAI